MLRLVAGAIAQEANDLLMEACYRKGGLEEEVTKLAFPENHRFWRYSLVRRLVDIEDFIGWVIARRICIAPKLTECGALLAALMFLRRVHAPFHFFATNNHCMLE